MKQNYQFGILSVILTAMFLFSVSSCSDDEVQGIQASVGMPDNANLMELDMWSYKIPFRVETDSKWKIEIDGQICYAFPEEGKGSSVVNLAVIDNLKDERQHGELRIVFPEDPSKNRTYSLEQKWSGDYDDNAVTIGRGNRVYAVGYGYDATSGFADPNSSRCAILKFEKMANEGSICYESPQAELKFQSYTGSNVADISNKLQAAAGVKGKGFGFKGEIQAAFDSKYYTSSQHEYALTYYNIIKERIVVEPELSRLRSKDDNGYMTASAYDAINGLIGTYGSTREGFRKLIKDYGTHMPRRASLGGRIRHCLTVDISKITSEYDINAFAAASYKNAFMNANASVDEKYRNSYENNKSSCTEKLSVSGGSTAAVNNLLSKGGFLSNKGFTQANVDKWQQSLTNDNMVLVGFEEEDLLPLYELVDEDHYRARHDSLKEYMEGNGMLEDFPPIETAFQCGTISKITIPSFNPDGTLIKEARIDGHVIAQICNEYIPMINKSERVTVVYPVIDNRPCYNMGYFIGNSSHRPCRVAWYGKNVTIREYDQNPIGTNSTLYLRGATFSTSTDMSPSSIATARIEDCYLSAPDITTPERGDGKYPLVKMFDRIWIRTDYRGEVRSSPEFRYTCRKGSFGEPYAYTLYAARHEKFPPIGWEVPKSSDYQAIIDYLQSNDVTGSDIGKSFLKDGVLGYRGNVGFSCPIGYYWTSDTGDNPNMIEMDSEKGTIAIVPAKISSINEKDEELGTGARYPVRFVKKP